MDWVCLFSLGFVYCVVYRLVCGFGVMQFVLNWLWLD